MKLTRDGECIVFDRHLGTFAKIVKDNENQISEPMQFSDLPCADK